MGTIIPVNGGTSQCHRKVAKADTDIDSPCVTETEPAAEATKAGRLCRQGMRGFPPFGEPVLGVLLRRESYFFGGAYTRVSPHVCPGPGEQARCTCWESLPLSCLKPAQTARSHSPVASCARCSGRFQFDGFRDCGRS